MNPFDDDQPISRLTAAKLKQSQARTLLRVLTNSERTTMACERRWWFRYVEGLNQFSTAPLRQGGLWHTCLAAWYRSNCTLTPSEIKLVAIDPWYESRKLWAENGGTPIELEEDFAIQKSILGMLEGYIHKFADDAKDFKVIAVEPQVGRMIINPNTGKQLRDVVTFKDGTKRNRVWSYGGAMDLLVEMRDGSHWFMEHKTTIERDLTNYTRKLHWDPQIRGYAWAAQRPLIAIGSGVFEKPLRLTGVIYNVARKKVPEEPQPLKNGGLSKAKDIDTTRDLYLSALKRHGLNPDLYADVLEQLSTKKFFHREPYVFTDNEIEDAGLDISHVALKTVKAERALFHTRQPSICTGIASQPCPYKHICLVDTPMGRSQFAVSAIRHEELTGELSEPYVARMRDVRMKAKTPQPKTLEQQLIESLDSPRQELYTIDPFSDD